MAQLNAAESYYYYDRTPYIVASGVAILATIIGYAIYSPAKKEVKQLELEGARKGYILASISPDFRQ